MAPRVTKPIDFPGHERAALVSANVSALIGAALQAKRQEQTRRDYLGASRLGEECLRRLAYEYHGAEEDAGAAFSDKTLRVFERGHDCEARMARYLKEAGFDLREEKEGGGQFGFYTAKDPATGRHRIRGHADGIIMGYARPAGSVWRDAALEGNGWANRLTFPMLWENKGVNNRNFNDIAKKGLAASKPLYYAQINLYMAYFDIPRALFTVENQDTCEIWADVMELDMAAAQSASDRGLAVVTSKRPEDLPQAYPGADYFACQWCPFKARCWAADPVMRADAVAVSAPSFML